MPIFYNTTWIHRNAAMYFCLTAEQFISLEFFPVHFSPIIISRHPEISFEDKCEIMQISVTIMNNRMLYLVDIKRTVYQTYTKVCQQPR